MHSAYHTALLLGLALNNSGQTRARVSSQTLKFLGRRKSLRYAFVYAVAEQMAELGWTLVELPGVGFGVIQTHALAAAKPVTGKKWLKPSLLAQVKSGRVTFSDIEEFLELNQKPDEE
jgi:hypothetical protein